MILKHESPFFFLLFMWEFCIIMVGKILICHRAYFYRTQILFLYTFLLDQTSKLPLSLAGA